MSVQKKERKRKWCLYKIAKPDISSSQKFNKSFGGHIVVVLWDVLSSGTKVDLATNMAKSAINSQIELITREDDNQWNHLAQNSGPP